MEQHFKKRTGWVNVYKDYDDTPIIGDVHNTREEDGYDGITDLFFAPEKENKHQGWINIYRHDIGNIRYPSFTIYNTEKEAKRERGNRCVATIKIEWEERYGTV